MAADFPLKYGPWTINASTPIYQDPWLSVRKDDVTRPDGEPGTYSVVEIKHGVCVLAWQGDQVYLTSEFHYAVGRTTLEAVSGGVDEGESQLMAAKRELKEELGITANVWKSLMTADPFTASVVSPTALFLATELEFGNRELEGTEQIQMVEQTISKAYKDVCEGTISHAPSGLAIMSLWIQQQLGIQQQLPKTDDSF